jgi:hypothetical protein
LDQPQEGRFTGVDETLYKLWQAPKAWFLQCSILGYLGVEMSSISKLISASTSIVGRLKFPANIESHPIEELMVDQMVGMISSASITLVTRSLVSITSISLVGSKFAFLESM